MVDMHLTKLNDSFNLEDISHVDVIYRRITKSHRNVYFVTMY